MATGVLLAAVSAVSFGVTTPLIRSWGAEIGPLTSAALLYAGAAALSLALRPFGPRSGRALTRAAAPRVLLVTLFGSVLAPTLLIWGLHRAGATSSSLVLNFEAAFTVLLAWLVYREPVGRRVILAVSAMVLGGALIAFDAAHALESTRLMGLVAVLAATACWASDNTLSRALADEDPLDVVAAKGLLGAGATGTLAWTFGEHLPDSAGAVALLLCGATGYGLSLRLYLLAQRRIGAARTGSVFAAGPFVGAAVGWALGDRMAGAASALGAVAFGVGIVLHLTERHSHTHAHEPTEHEHAHRHDDGHHDHRHEPPFQGEHTHRHRHELIEHSHPHAPDIHHEHSH